MPENFRFPQLDRKIWVALGVVLTLFVVFLFRPSQPSLEKACANIDKTALEEKSARLSTLTANPSLSFEDATEILQITDEVFSLTSPVANALFREEGVAPDAWNDARDNVNSTLKKVRSGEIDTREKVAQTLQGTSFNLASPSDTLKLRERYEATPACAAVPFDSIF